MAWIDKNLLPSLRMIDSFRSMRKIRIQGIPFMENRPVKFSKTGNKFVLDFTTQIAEHNSVESAKYSNLPQFTFAHGNRSYIVPDGMSRITTYRDNILGRVSNDFSIEVEAQIIHSSKIRPDCKYFFRYFVPVEKGVYFGDYAYYYFLCQGKQAGSLIKISLPGNEIHLYHFGYKNGFYLVVESIKSCYLTEIENIAYAALLTLGFLSGTLHLQEAFIIASKSDRYTRPVGLYYKSLRESISGQYSVFTTNAYSVLVPISRKMKARNAESRMMLIIEKRWKYRIQPIKEEVFSAMTNLFITHEPVARAALLTLTASKLGLELQAGVYCIAFETLCDTISKIYNLSAPHVINETHWQTILPALSDVIRKASLPQDAASFAMQKIQNLNQPTNRDKLMQPFMAVKYQLSGEEIRVIKDRNRFLHGHLNVQSGENEIDKLFYTSLMFHRLCCILILKMSGFDGHIVNNIPLYAADLHITTNEWGFKKI